MVRLIALDLDNTLLDPSGRLTARTKLALKEAMARGVLVVLASGRMVEAMRDIADEIGVNAPLIAFNGALAWDLKAERPVCKTPLKMADAIEICRWAEAGGMHIQAYPDGGYFYEAENEYSKYYASKLNFRGAATGVKMSEFIKSDVNKLLIVSTEENCARAAEEINRAFAFRAAAFRSRPVYVEIVNPLVNKGRGLTELAEKLSVPMADTIAFGDEDNDLPMLIVAGRGYAMENAKPQIREQARFIAPSNALDGVAQIIEKLIEEGEMDW